MEATLYTDPFGGKRTFHSFADSEFAVETKLDVEPLLKENRAEYNSRAHKDRRWRGEGVGERVASVPFVAFHEWLRQRYPEITPYKAYRLFLTDAETIARFLNDTENSGFRIRPGKV